MKPVNRALNTNQVRSIRSRFSKGQTKAELARYFDVSARTIGRVVSGESYADVTNLSKK